MTLTRNQLAAAVLTLLTMGQVAAVALVLLALQHGPRMLAAALPSGKITPVAFGREADDAARAKHEHDTQRAALGGWRALTPAR